jgi:flagellar protein FliO/FliZ
VDRKTSNSYLRPLVVLAALCMLAATTTVRGDETAASPISVQRPGYGAITLKSPTQSTGSQPSGGLPLQRPQSGDHSESPATPSRTSAVPLVTIGSSLALVLGLFAALVWVSKKTGAGSGHGGVVPDEALKLLGQKSLGAAGSIALVRCGRSVLVVGISAAGMHSLAEITDEEEVRNLEATCLGESAASFQAALGEMQKEPAGHGFIGDGIAASQARKKLFADR